MLGFTLPLVIGICLGVLSSAFAIDLWKSLARGALPSDLVVHGLVLALLWGLWSILPDCLRIVIRRLLKKRSDDNPD